MNTREEVERTMASYSAAYPVAYHVLPLVDKSQLVGWRPSTASIDLGQLLGRNQAVAAGHELGNLLPVDPAEVQPEGDPAAWAYVGGTIELFGIYLDQLFVFAQSHLAAHGHDAVSVMIAEEIGERLLADPKDRVQTAPLAGSLGKPEADLREPGKPGVFVHG